MFWSTLKRNKCIGFSRRDLEIWKSGNIREAEGASGYGVFGVGEGRGLGGGGYQLTTTYAGSTRALVHLVQLAFSAYRVNTAGSTSEAAKSLLATMKHVLRTSYVQ
jgi:hypothetical protein